MAYNQEFNEWSKSKEALNGESCTLIPIKPIMGKAFEYDYAPTDFKNAVLKVFDALVKDFQTVPHVQKYVLDRVYFPHPRLVQWVVFCIMR